MANGGAEFFALIGGKPYLIHHGLDETGDHFRSTVGEIQLALLDPDVECPAREIGDFSTRILLSADRLVRNAAGNGISPDLVLGKLGGLLCVEAHVSVRSVETLLESLRRADLAEAVGINVQRFKARSGSQVPHQRLVALPR